MKKSVIRIAAIILLLSSCKTKSQSDIIKKEIIKEMRKDIRAEKKEHRSLAKTY